jgi:ribosomal 50S subunit-recycling heat shock protein
VANEACAGGRVTVNGKIAKPGTSVTPGDLITIRFGEHLGQYEVISISETVRKDQAADMYRVISEDDSMNTERNMS